MLKELEINGELADLIEVRVRAANIRQEREASGVALDLEQRLAVQDEALALVVDRMLLVQEARRLGMTPDEQEITNLLQEIAARFDGIAGCRAGMDTPESRIDLGQRVMVDRILDRWRASVRAPQNDELRSYYRQNKEQFYAPELIHASHFVRACDNQETAELVQAEVEKTRNGIMAGEDFAAVAGHHSDCPENGGNLGWFGRGVMVEEFDRVVLASPIGQLTPVFRTVFGFHFAVVHERKPEGIRSFSDVLSEVARIVWLMKQDHEVGRKLAELRARAVIKVVR